MGTLNGPLVAQDFVDYYFPDPAPTFPSSTMPRIASPRSSSSSGCAAEDIASNLSESLNAVFSRHGLTFYLSDSLNDPDIIAVVEDHKKPQDHSFSLYHAALVIACRPATPGQSFDLQLLATHAKDVFARSMRNWMYALHITETAAALVRFDAFGITYTRPFAYTGDSDMLRRFFWTFLHCSKTACGFDVETTFTVAPDSPEARIARHALRQWGSCTDDMGDTVESSRDVVRIEVPTKDIEGPKYVYGWVPLHQSEFPGHLNTSIYPVYDPLTSRVRCLKDSWRDIHRKVTEEHVLIALQSQRCPNIPQYVNGGPLLTVNAAGKRCRRRIKNPFYKGRELIHYRILTEDVLSPIVDFSSTKELMEGFCDAVSAHQDAHEIGILWNNVSHDHLMVNPTTGNSVLCDWSEAVVWDPEKHRNHPKTSPGVDLRHFIFSLLYICLRYVQHSHSSYVNDILKEFPWLMCQSEASSQYFSPRTTFFEFTNRPILTALICDLVGLHEAMNDGGANLGWRTILSTIGAYLQRPFWPEGDCSVDFLDEEVMEELVALEKKQIAERDLWSRFSGLLEGKMVEAV